VPPAAAGVITATAPTAGADTGPACVAVVVHYLDAASTVRCVRSLHAQPERPHVVVVDNASPDGSGRLVRAAFAGNDAITVLTSAHNGGFGAGCNLGIAHALQRWPRLGHVLLLNPDAELTPHALGELLATARAHPRAGIVGCRIEDGHGQTWFGSGRIPRWTLAGFHTTAPAAAEHRADFVTGACMLLAGDLLRLGLRFDERYFLYCEDADLCEAVRANGRELWITHRARAVHHAGGSQPGEPVLGELTASRLYWLTRGKAIFAARHLGFVERCVFWLVATIGKPLLGVLRTRSLAFLPPYWRGRLDGALAARRPR